MIEASDVTSAVAHPNGRLDVALTLNGEPIRYGVVPGSGDTSPLHQRLEKLHASGQLAAVTQPWAGPVPAEATTETIQDVQGRLLNDLKEAYEDRIRPLLNPIFEKKIAEARSYLLFENEDDPSKRPPDSAYPVLAATLGVDGSTLSEVARTVHRRHLETGAELGRIECAYYQAWQMIEAASTVEEKQRAFASVTWG